MRTIFTRNFSLLIFMFLTFGLFSQELFLEQLADLKVGLSNKTDVFQLTDESSGDIALFLMDKKVIHALLYNKEFNFKKSISTDRPPKKFINLIGGNNKNNSFYLFFTDKKQRNFMCQKIDFSKANTFNTEIPIDLKRERYLESVS